MVENGKDHHYWCAMVMRGDNKHGIKVDPEGKRSVYMFPKAQGAISRAWENALVLKLVFGWVGIFNFPNQRSQNI